MGLLGFWLMIAFWDGPVQLETTVALAPLDDDGDHFLSLPLDFDVTEQGFFLVDGEAKVVFHWDTAGSFVGTIGQPGSGPGEFTFAGRGAPQAGVAVHGDKLYVYDGGNRKIAIFDAAGSFIENRTLPAMRARIQRFAILPDGALLLQRSRFTDEERVNELVVLDNDGQTRVLLTTPMTGFTMRGERGDRRFTVRAFHPTLTSHYHPGSGEILVGDGSEPAFRVLKLDGSGHRLALPLGLKPVTTEDRAEFDQTIDDRRRQRTTFEFPDHKPFYDQILPVDKSGYLAFSMSPYYRDVTGIYVDRAGKLLGRLTVRCGEGGGLLGARGRLLLVTVDDEGSFQIREVKP